MFMMFLVVEILRNEFVNLKFGINTMICLNWCPDFVLDVSFSSQNFYTSIIVGERDPFGMYVARIGLSAFLFSW